MVSRLERFLVPIIITFPTKTLTMNNSFVFFANYYCFFVFFFGCILADGSFEYTDSTGTDLHDFIIKTLKNPRWAYTPFFDLYKNSILLFSCFLVFKKTKIEGIESDTVFKTSDTIFYELL